MNDLVTSTSNLVFIENGKVVTDSKPQISEKTMEEMVKFFMKTSIPRIMEERRKANEQKR